MVYLFIFAERTEEICLWQIHVHAADFYTIVVPLCFISSRCWCDVPRSYFWQKMGISEHLDGDSRACQEHACFVTFWESFGPSISPRELQQDVKMINGANHCPQKW